MTNDGAWVRPHDGDAGMEHVERVPFSQAEAYFPQGLAPASARIAGYLVGYVPAYVTGTIYGYDGDDDAGRARRLWLPDEIPLLYKTDGQDIIDGPYALAYAELAITVRRNPDYTHADAYLEIAEEATAEEAFRQSDAGEPWNLPYGRGYYSHCQAIVVPEAGLAITVELTPQGVDPQKFGERYGLDEPSLIPRGDPNEVRNVVEGLTKESPTSHAQ